MEAFVALDEVVFGVVFAVGTATAQDKAVVVFFFFELVGVAKAVNVHLATVDLDAFGEPFAQLFGFGQGLVEAVMVSRKGTFGVSRIMLTPNLR